MLLVDLKSYFNDISFITDVACVEIIVTFSNKK